MNESSGQGRSPVQAGGQQETSSPETNSSGPCCPPPLKSQQRVAGAVASRTATGEVRPRLGQDVFSISGESSEDDPSSGAVSAREFQSASAAFLNPMGYEPPDPVTPEVRGEAKPPLASGSRDSGSELGEEEAKK